MFSTKEKQHIATEIEKLLLSINHPEMPKERPAFRLHVDGTEAWSWADIEPNWKYESRSQMKPNPWNEQSHEQIEQQSAVISSLFSSDRNIQPKGNQCQ